MGTFETDPCMIADIMATWLGPERALFEQMARKGKSLGRPDAVFKIIRDLGKLVHPVEEAHRVISQKELAPMLQLEPITATLTK